MSDTSEAMPSAAPTATFLDSQKLADQIEQKANEVFGGNKLCPASK
jgi:hypothetical protein